MAHDWKPLGKLTDTALWQCRKCHTIVEVPHGWPPSPDRLVSVRYTSTSGKPILPEFICEEVIANEVMNT